MDDESDFRKWDELIPDALGLIFKNLSLLEVLTVVPRVCKSWGKAVMGPYCWQEIDIEQWSKNREPEIVDRMLQLLISRAVVRPENSVSQASPATKAFCSWQIIIETAAQKLFALTSIDLSYCLNIGAQALEAIGKNCKSLTMLQRVMHPLEVIHMHSQEDEALAIAMTMQKLKHLEIAYLLISTSSVIEILKGCKHLEVLDIRGCWNVELDDKFVKGFSKLKVVGPVVMDCYEPTGWENCSDYSGSSGYLAWDFVAGEVDDDYYAEMMGAFSEDENPIEDNVEMWFYDDVDALDAGYDWPLSP